jgi:hypothetical protein
MKKTQPEPFENCEEETLVMHLGDVDRNIVIRVDLEMPRTARDYQFEKFVVEHLVTSAARTIATNTKMKRTCGRAMTYVITNVTGPDPGGPGHLAGPLAKGLLHPSRRTGPTSPFSQSQRGQTQRPRSASGSTRSGS